MKNKKERKSKIEKTDLIIFLIVLKWASLSSDYF